MRRLWRICRRKWAATACDGEGARGTGGRWNHKGDAVAYCSTSLALAALELFVNIDPCELPDDLVSVALEVPDDVPARVVTPAELTPDWRDYPAPEPLKDLGSDWLRGGDELLLIVPSAIIPEENNALINPAHADFARCQPGKPTPFLFDPRMWKSRD